MKRFEGTIYRLPVVKREGSLEPIEGQLPQQLLCEDFDPETGERTGTVCQDRFHAKHGYFSCAGLKTGTCARSSFLYPRKFEGGHKIHHHQGIDIAGGHFKAQIVSVCDGVVERAARVYESGVGGYGRTIVIRGEETSEPRWYLYAHCFTIADGLKTGTRVRAGQVIGTVGISDTAKDPISKKSYIFNGTKTSNSHLHFEVSASGYWKDQWFDESRPDDFVPGAAVRKVARLDPFVELAALGPWGMREVFVPVLGGVEVKVTPDVVAQALKQVEEQPHGGYFPLGANNTWHGGLHLRAGLGSTIVAPFDAEIVALRLDADPTTAHAGDDITGLGSTNFIILRHEISELVADLLLGKPLDPTDPTDPTGPKGKGKPIPNAVGRGAENDPARVIDAKVGLHAHFDADGRPLYAPLAASALTDPAPDEALFTAIEALQETLPKPKKMKKKHPWPDGVMTVGGYTWNAIFGPSSSKQKAEAPTGSPEGEDPAADEPAKPAVVPKPKTPPDPKRTLYSILMHLGAQPIDAKLADTFKWLGGATVAPRPGHEDDDIIRAQNEDIEHAKRGITKRVGFPTPAPTDVADLLDADVDPGTPGDIQWVQERLQRLVDYTGVADGTWSEELREAIADFQRQHTNFFREGSGNVAPGFVGAKLKGKKTAKPETLLALKRTRAEQGGASPDGVDGVDPLLLARLAERDALGVARVVSGLSIPVRSGDPLWISGKAQGFDGPEEVALFEQIHWGLFSEHPLADWHTLVDVTEDLQIDLPDEIFELVEVHEIQGFARDKRLVPEEIVEFYAHPRSQFLRRTMCKFRSEWAVDVPKWLSGLKAAGFGVSSLIEALQSFAVWDAAADVLPSSPHVWHYNPLEFIGRYAELLAQLAPKSIAPPASAGGLRVRVTYSDGQPWSHARVALAYFGQMPRNVEANVSGVVEFSGLVAGSGIVWLDEHATDSAFFDLAAGESELVELVAPLAGPAKSTGTVRVWVLDPESFGLAMAEVIVEADGALVLEALTDGDGYLEFDVGPGEYEVTAVGETKVIELLASSVLEVELQRPDTGTLVVKVRFSDGTPGVSQRVGVAQGDQDVTSKTSDGAGVVEFDRLAAGVYTAFVAGIPDSASTAEVVGQSTQHVNLVIPLGDIVEPSSSAGFIDVFVLDANNLPCAGRTVWLLDDAHLQVEDTTTDDEGAAVFDDLEPGTYGIEVEDGAADALGLAVTGGSRTRVVVRAEAPHAPSDPVKPKPKPATGSMRVTFVFMDGSAVIGTVKVSRDGFTVVASKHLEGDEKGTAEFRDLPVGKYIVYLDGFEAYAIDIDLPAGGTVPLLIPLPV